jgi:hypothetical protein
MIESEGEKFVCFGPISLLNHSCGSLVSLQTHPDPDAPSKAIVQNHLTAKQTWTIEKGDEVTIRYASTFDNCFCDSCKEKVEEIVKEEEEDSN